MAQRLVRRLCNNCKEEYTPTKQELGLVGLDPSRVPNSLYKAKGCAECRNTGYKGRTAIHEILEVNTAMKQLIFEDANQNQIKEAAKQAGMTTLRQAGIEKILEGKTDINEVLRATVEDS